MSDGAFDDWADFDAFDLPETGADLVESDAAVTVITLSDAAVTVIAMSDELVN